MDLNLDSVSVEKITLPLFLSKELEVFVLRLDRIHDEISGNKWFKLRYYLEEAEYTGKTRLLSFGGPWSNHILATAAAAFMNKWGSIGIIRGDEKRGLNEMLARARDLGMEFHFISRTDYKHKKIPGGVMDDYTLVIPEGGAGVQGIRGAATILDHCNKNEFNYILCASGTGTMAAGLTAALSPGQQVIPVTVLKGFGKINSSLIRFMNIFYQQTGIPTDFVYTGKLFLAAIEMIAGDQFAPGSKLLIVHSGGLQGNRSLPKGTLIF